MCGRFVLYSEPELIRAAFRLALPTPPELTPRFNIAPSQPIPVIRHTFTGRSLAHLRWGLVASWTTDPTTGPHPINARSETVHSRAAFKEAYQRRRCLIPADGFYEWQVVGKKKQPRLIQIDGGTTFAMAGLWERWIPPDPSIANESIESCTILTTDANDALRPIHDRMPVILDPDDYDAWLDPARQAPEHLAEFLKPLANDRVGHFPVGQLVNSPANDTPQCLEPVEPLDEDEPDGPTLFSGLA